IRKNKNLNMRSVKILSILAIFTFSVNINAQFLKKLGKTAERAAERTVEKRVDKETSKKTDETIDSVFQNKKDNESRTTKEEKHDNKEIIDNPTNKKYDISTNFDFTPGNKPFFR